MSGRRFLSFGIVVVFLTLCGCVHGIAGAASDMPPVIWIEGGGDGSVIDISDIILELPEGVDIEDLIIDGYTFVLTEDGDLVLIQQEIYPEDEAEAYDEAYESPNNNVEVIITPGVEGAIAEGLILFLYDEMEQAATAIVPVVVRDLYHRLRMNVFMEFDKVERLTFTRTHGYVSLFVQAGDFVREGDLLANLSFEDEEFIINRRFAEIRLEQFDRSFAQTVQDREDAIELARQNLLLASDREYAAQTIAIQLMEADLQIFRREMSLQRVVVYDYLYEINSTIAGDNIYAPFDGMITRTVHDGSFIRGFDQILTIVDHMSFYFTLTPETRGVNAPPDIIPDNTLINFGNIITIRNATGHVVFVIGAGGEVLSTRWEDSDDDDYDTPLFEFDIKIVNDPRSRDRFTFADFRAMPVDIPGVLQLAYDSGLSLIAFGDIMFVSDIYIHYGTNSVVIPRGAMRQGAGEAHYVFKYSNGVSLRRYITTGVILQDYVQVLSGLDAGSSVVVFR